MNLDTNTNADKKKRRRRRKDTNANKKYRETISCNSELYNALSRTETKH